MPIRSSEATWNGNLPEGKGTMKVGAGAYEGAYSFRSRFEEGEGTNPEELIGAAHAGCFSMAFANMLDEAGYSPETVHTEAKVHLEMNDEGPRIAKIELRTEADVADIDEQDFQQIAEQAKEGCPVSQVLAGADITLSATLNQGSSV